MVLKKKISARIETDLLNDYVDQFQKYREVKFKGDYPVKELTITQILEEALFYATKYLEEKNTLEK